MARASIALSEMKEDIWPVKPIFLTVDPERDSPEVIGKYLKISTFVYWYFRRLETLMGLVKNYGVFPKEKHHGDNQQIDHGYSTFILNSLGEIEVAVLPGLPPSHLTELLFKMTEGNSEIII